MLYFLDNTKDSEKGKDMKEDLTQLTKKETNQAIEHLSSLSLAELRNRQDIVLSEQIAALEELDETTDPVRRAELELIIKNLVVRKQHLIQAIRKVDAS